MTPSVAELLANPYIPRVLEVILGATIVFFAVISVILLYHWRKYEPSNGRMIFTSFIYFGGALMLLGETAYYLFLFLK